MIDSPSHTEAAATAKILPSIFIELEKLGHDKHSVFKRVGIHGNADDVAALTASEQSALFNYACCLLASETSSRQHKDFVNKTATDMLMYCVINCETLAEVIERTAEFCSLVETIGISVRLVQKGSLAELDVDIGRSTLDRPSLLLTVAAMSTFYQLFSWLVATDLKLTEVGLRYDSGDVAVLAKAFQGQPLLYNQASDYFIFPAADLALPVVRNYQQLKQVVDFFPVNLVMTSSGNVSFATRVREIVCSALSSGSPAISLEIAAQLVNTSPATLRRKLRDEGSSFSQILNTSQQLEAEKYLRTQMPIKAIAVQLGFSDDRAFRRAFKRWSGQTPTAFRAQCQR